MRQTVFAAAAILLASFAHAQPRDNSVELGSVLQPSILSVSGMAVMSAPGTLQPGDVIYSVPVQYGVTGKLTTNVKAVGLRALAGSELEAGTPVYGLRMGQQKGSAPGLTWCAPRATKAGNGKLRTNTVCFPHAVGPNARWVATGDELLATLLLVTKNTSGATAVTVEAGPAEFGFPMQLNLEFSKWKKDAIEVVLVLHSDGQARQVLRKLTAPYYDQPQSSISVPGTDIIFEIGRPSPKSKELVLGPVVRGNLPAQGQPAY